MRSFYLVFAIALGVFTTNAYASLKSGQDAVHREQIRRLDSKRDSVELYWEAPKQSGKKYPAIIYIHGVQDQSRPGAINLVHAGVLDLTADSGVLAVAMSMPGYGGSTGMPDFCGRNSQLALRSVIRSLRSRPDIDLRKIAVSGLSCGAIVAARVADKEPLAAMILVSGVYDFQDMYAKWQTPQWKLEPDVLSYIDRAVAADGGIQLAAKFRSSLPNASRFKMPVLLIAGKKDRIVDNSQSISLANALRSNARPFELKIDPQGGHMISAEEWVKDSVDFLEKSVRN